MSEYEKEKCDLRGREGQEIYWKAFFGKKKLRKPYKGAVKDFANRLGKLLPEGTELTIEEIIEACNG